MWQGGEPNDGNDSEDNTQQASLLRDTGLQDRGATGTSKIGLCQFPVGNNNIPTYGPHEHTWIQEGAPRRSQSLPSHPLVCL